jgi:rhodanese-related sulfurtransferase
MPTDIDHDELRQMTAEGALLLDVRDRAGYDAEHLPGAMSLPLKTLDRETTAHLDRDRPLITYCWEWT